MKAPVSIQRPQVTIAVCTMGRPRDLRSCLTSLTRQDADPAAYEVLVVDNGRSEVVEGIAADFSDVGVQVRYAWEPLMGITFARRRAWKAAIGDNVAFIDDDAVAHPSWVSSIADAFATNSPALALIGGPVNNVRGLQEPWPFTPEPASNGLYLGDAFREVQPEENLWGCNFAMRKSVMVSLDAFGEPIGPRGTRPGANEDIIVQRQVDQAGLKRAYDPRMQIVHNSWRARATFRQQSRLAFYTGVDNSMMTRLLGDNSPSERAREVRSRAKRLRAQLVASLRANQDGDTTGAQVARLAATQSLGTIVGQLWPPLEPHSKPDQ